MKKNDVLKKVIEPEVNEILKDAGRISRRMGYNGLDVANDFEKYFPEHYRYYQGLIQGLWLVHKIEDRDEYWEYFNNRVMNSEEFPAMFKKVG